MKATIQFPGETPWVLEAATIAIRFPGSSNIDSAAYDPESSELFVRFKNQWEYVYKAVPVDIFGMLVHAPSPGSFLNASIKGIYECSKWMGGARWPVPKAAAVEEGVAPV